MHNEILNSVWVWQTALPVLGASARRIQLLDLLSVDFDPIELIADIVKIGDFCDTCLIASGLRVSGIILLRTLF